MSLQQRHRCGRPGRAVHAGVALFLLLLTAAGCAGGQGSTEVHDSTRYVHDPFESWKAYRDLLVVDHPYPSALTPGEQAYPVASVITALTVREAMGLASESDLVDWLEAQRVAGSAFSNELELGALLQRVRRVPSPELLAMITEEAAGLEVTDPMTQAQLDGVISEQADAGRDGGRRPTDCTKLISQTEIHRLVTLWGEGLRCQPERSVTSSDYVDLSLPQLTERLSVDMAHVDLGYATADPKELADIASTVWTSALSSVDPRGMLGTGQLVVFAMAAELAIASDVRLPASDLLSFSTERVLRWRGQLPDRVVGPDPLRGLAVLSILETLGEFADLPDDRESYLNALVSETTALPEADVALLERWGVERDRFDVRTDAIGAGARSLLALSDDAECDEVVRSIDEFRSSDSISVFNRLAEAYAYQLLEGCTDEMPVVDHLGEGDPLIEAWVDTEIACMRSEKQVVERSRHIVAAVVEQDDPDSVYRFDDGAYLVVDTRTGLGSVLGTLSYIRLARIAEFGCGGFTPWEGIG